MYPKVSVTVITYNQKPFLIECIASILDQGYPNLEIVVGDDGSTDGTREMLLDWHARLPNTFVLRLAERNRGITANNNAVFHACTGEYIAWMGGDDLMLSGKLERQVGWLETHRDAAICYHDLDVFESSTGRSIARFNDPRGPNPPRVGGAEVVVEHGTFMGACSVVTRRSACPPHGFDPRIPTASDWLFWIETALNGRVEYIDEILGRYRRHTQNVTRGWDIGSDQLRTLRIVDERFPHLREHARRYRRRHCWRFAVKCMIARRPLEAPRQLAAWAASLRPASLAVGPTSSSPRS
jgi:glycosyltransferase involved in cell wall biosynthesis